MENWVQNLAFLFCWLVGCFPAVSPFEKSPNFLFKWRSTVTCYSLLLIAIAVVDSCVAVQILLWLSPLFENRAYAIITLVCGFTGRAVILLVRTLAVFSAEQTITLIRDLKSLQHFCLENGRSKSLQIHRRWKGVVLATLVALICKVYRHFEFAKNQLTRSGTYDPLATGNSTGTASPYAPYWIWVSTNNTLVENAAMILIVFLSMTIAQSHLAYMQLLEEESNVPEEVGIRKKGMLETELMQRFFGLKHSFKAFTKVVGLYAFLTIIWDGVTILYNIYFMFWPKLDEISELSLVYTIASPLIVIYCGNNIQNQVNEWRDRFDEIQTQMTLSGLKNTKLLPLVKSVRRWEWKLRSADIFTINNGAIPALIGALTTFLIFIVQLEISEPTTER